MSQPTITLGISSCLMGKPVRWDGGDKQDRLFTEQLSQDVQYCAVCPEVESGFGVPREPFCLVGDTWAPRLVTMRTRQDCTRRMLQWAEQRVKELESAGLCGFIFKGKSPSCGMEGVRVYGEKGETVLTGIGLFARVFMTHFPHMPVEDDTRLHDPLLREDFIERACAMKQSRVL